MAKRFGKTPSEVLRTNPQDFAIDVAVALRAEKLELEAKTGQFWYLHVLDALFGSGEGKKTNDKDVNWFN